MPPGAGGVLLGVDRTPINRQPAKMPAVAYRTYSIAKPRATHWRPAACREVGCPRADGWVTVLDEETQAGRLTAWYIRHQAGRRYRESRDPRGMTVFTFASGQRCFAEHVLPVGRPALLVVRDGDWRGNPTGWVRRHTRREHWVEDFAQHQDTLATAQQRG